MGCLFVSENKKKNFDFLWNKILQSFRWKYNTLPNLTHNNIETVPSNLKYSNGQLKQRIFSHQTISPKLNASVSVPEFTI